MAHMKILNFLKGKNPYHSARKAFMKGYGKTWYKTEQTEYKDELRMLKRIIRMLKRAVNYEMRIGEKFPDFKDELDFLQSKILEFLNNVEDMKRDFKKELEIPNKLKKLWDDLAVHEQKLESEGSENAAARVMALRKQVYAMGVKLLRDEMVVIDNHLASLEKLKNDSSAVNQSIVAWAQRCAKDHPDEYKKAKSDFVHAEKAVLTAVAGFTELQDIVKRIKAEHAKGIDEWNKWLSEA